MQLMPATARRMADSLGWSDFDVGRAHDNILLGTCHLAELLALTGGRLPVALAAYNAGLDRAWRWWRSARGFDDFIERIGFVETRGFVRNVLTHFAYYRSLYAGAGERGDD
jgi:soluble lytic murein transglycosylase